MKKIAALFLALLMTVSMMSFAMADDVTEITIWSMYTGDDFKVIQGVVDAFNAANPDVKVNHVAMEAYTDLYVKMPLVAGDDSAAPHLCVIHSSSLPQFALQNVIEPLDEFLSAYGDFSESQYNSSDAGKYDGVRYGLPFCAPTVVTYCNLDLANKYCPEIIEDGIITWDELYTAADRMVADGVTDVKLCCGSWGRNDMINAYEQCGGTYYADGDAIDTVTIDKEALLEATNLWKGLYDKGMAQSESDDPMGMFALEETIFVTGGTWNLTAVESYGLNFSMMPSIQKDASNTYNWGAVECIVKERRNVSEAEQLACLRFLEYLRQNSIEWAKSGAIVMAKEVADSDEFKAMPQGGATINGTETKAAFHVYSGAIIDTFNTLGFQAVYGYITPEEYVESMQAMCQEAVNAAK